MESVMRWIDIINEGKDAPLYHGTTIKQFPKILQTGKLVGRPTRIHAVSNKEHVEVTGISVTRDKFLRYSSERGIMGGSGRLSAPIVFELNQTNISQNFKIVPQHAAGQSRADWNRNSNNSESEEIIVAPNGLPITNHYIKCILVFAAIYSIYYEPNKGQLTLEEIEEHCKSLGIPVKIIGNARNNSPELARHSNVAVK
jgi:hypothetical protein